jgi:hypothetical protein
MLTDVEREHLFLLGLGRPPEVRYQAAESVTPRLQRVLDALELSPALVKTATWDIVAWNRAAAAVLTDYGSLAPEQRNILRLIFLDPRVRAAQLDWESVARFVVAAFRADAARAGAAKWSLRMNRRLSPEFEAMWRVTTCVLRREGVKYSGIDRRADRVRISGLRGRWTVRSGMVITIRGLGDADRIRSPTAARRHDHRNGWSRRQHLDWRLGIRR